MDIAYQVGYIDKNIFEDVEEKAIQIGKMPGALIKARTSGKRIISHRPSPIASNIFGRNLI